MGIDQNFKTQVTLHLLSGMSDVPMKPSFLHRFVEKPQIKIFSFQTGKHGFLMQFLIRQSFAGYWCESEYILILFLIF